MGLDAIINGVSRELSSDGDIEVISYEGVLQETNTLTFQFEPRFALFNAIDEANGGARLIYLYQGISFGQSGGRTQNAMLSGRTVTYPKSSKLTDAVVRCVGFR